MKQKQIIDEQHARNESCTMTSAEAAFAVVASAQNSICNGLVLYMDTCKTTLLCFVALAPGHTPHGTTHRNGHGMTLAGRITSDFWAAPCYPPPYISITNNAMASCKIMVRGQSIRRGIGKPIRSKNGWALSDGSLVGAVGSTIVSRIKTTYDLAQECIKGFHHLGPKDSNVQAITTTPASIHWYQKACFTEACGCTHRKVLK